MLKKVEAKCKRCGNAFLKKRTDHEFCKEECRNAAWKKPRKRRLKGTPRGSVANGPFCSSKSVACKPTSTPDFGTFVRAQIAAQQKQPNPIGFTLPDGTRGRVWLASDSEGDRIIGDDRLWRVNIEELLRHKERRFKTTPWTPTAEALRRPIIVVGRLSDHEGNMRYLIQRCAAVVIGFWLCNGSAAAWADWQYTKWGMTEPQVVAASKGAAGRVAPKDVKGGRIGTVNLLSASYRTGRYEFTAIFAFDGVTRKLATVTLKVINPSDGYGVKSELIGKYGKPTRTSDGGTSAITEWQTDTEVITFIDVWGRSFSVEYRPRSTDASKGL